MRNIQAAPTIGMWLLVATMSTAQGFAQTAPPLRVIDLTGEWAARVHEDAIYRGAGGFLGDYEGLPINAASRQMAESWDPSVVSQLVGRRRQDDPIDQLTPREREVLELMAEGLSNIAIAERLVVTERAVEKHVTSIFGKLRLGADSEHHRRVLAVLAYLRA